MRARRRLVSAAMCVAVLGFGLTLDASAQDGGDGAPPDPEATEEPHSYVVEGHRPGDVGYGLDEDPPEDDGTPHTFRVPGHTHEEEEARRQAEAQHEAQAVAQAPPGDPLGDDGTPHTYIVPGHTPEEEEAREAAEAARIQAEAQAAQAAGFQVVHSYIVVGHRPEDEAARLQGQAGDEPADDHIVHAYTISAHGPEEAPADIPSYVPPVTEWGAPPPVGGTVIVTTGNCPGGTHVDQCVDHEGTAYNICYGAPTDSE